MNGYNIQVESKTTSGLVAEKSFIWFRGRQSCGTIFVEIQKQTKYQVQLQRQFLRLEIRIQKEAIVSKINFPQLFLFYKKADTKRK